jgi:L-Ala-D/L-Glu epimerase
MALQLQCYKHILELKQPFTTSHGVRTHQPTLIVAITDGTHIGYGEAPAITYYGQNLDQLQQQVANLTDFFSTINTFTPEYLWPVLQQRLPSSFALAAVDMALHDLSARQQGKPLFQALGLDPANNPVTNYTIGIDTPANMLAKMQAMPWPIYKVKLGTEYDLQIMQLLTSHSKATFRVDANAGWTLHQALDIIPKLAALGVEFIEQPLAANNLEEQKILFKESPLPIIADESCQTEQDIVTCAPLFHGVNIKFMKCGGITPALRMLQQANNLGLKTMLGCMTESSVGCSAIAHLLPLLDYVDLDGILLVHDHIARGISINYGQVHYALGAGTGVTLL